MMQARRALRHVMLMLLLLLLVLESISLTQNMSTREPGTRSLGVACHCVT
jgi:hypothetical protein